MKLAECEKMKYKFPKEEVEKVLAADAAYIAEYERLFAEKKLCKLFIVTYLLYPGRPSYDRTEIILLTLIQPRFFFFFCGLFGQFTLTSCKE